MQLAYYLLCVCLCVRARARGTHYVLASLVGTGQWRRVCFRTRPCRRRQQSFRRQARPKYTHGVYRFPIKGYARRRRRRSVMTVVRNIATTTTTMVVISGQVSGQQR